MFRSWFFAPFLDHHHFYVTGIKPNTICTTNWPCNERNFKKSSKFTWFMDWIISCSSWRSQCSKRTHIHRQVHPSKYYWPRSNFSLCTFIFINLHMKNNPQHMYTMDRQWCPMERPSQGEGGFTGIWGVVPKHLTCGKIPRIPVTYPQPFFSRGLSLGCHWNL